MNSDKPITGSPQRSAKPKCLEVTSWRLPTSEEFRKYLDDLQSNIKKRKKKRSPTQCVLAVRTYLNPLDMYCYMKARFGIPNGFQTFLKNKDSSDNWIHWDFLLHADDVLVHICGMSREIHFLIDEPLTDDNWHELLSAIKADYKRVGKEKSKVYESLQQWVRFPNKFMQVANLCAEHHEKITDNMHGYTEFKTPFVTNKGDSKAIKKALDKLSKRAMNLYGHCLQLSLLTPILAESFINLLILILSKDEIRDNKRQMDAFIRSNIDTKIFDLHLKCRRFSTKVDPDAAPFKTFKRVMDKRNNFIHGNCNPEREQFEKVFFDDKIPLYPVAGDPIGKFQEAVERQYNPKEVINDYEETFRFLIYLVGCLEPDVRSSFWQIMEDERPGYDIRRRRMGKLFPNDVKTVIMSHIRHDDELKSTNN